MPAKSRTERAAGDRSSSEGPQGATEREGGAADAPTGVGLGSYKEAATEIREAHSAQDVAQARALFEEYARALGVDLCFQGFAEELATLPGAYAPPRGRLLLAGPTDEPFGCIALRPLAGPGESAPRILPACGEVKRLYVRPERRGTGCGRDLAERVIGEARRIGYRELKLDTLATMASAQRLYESLGFVPCAPYYANPLPGVVYLSRRL